VSRRRGFEKLSSEHASIAKAKVQSWIHNVFSDQIEFVADVPARAGICVNGNCPTAGIEVVMGRG
jgi:hypothetical protein